MNLGFFCSMSAEISTLSHMGVNEFGKWAKVRVEDHPEVQVKLELDMEGYEELQLQPRPPSCHKSCDSTALVDTGAQMVVVDLKTVYSMGLGKKHVIPVGMKIKAANTGGLKLIGGILVKITGRNKDGVMRSTRQLAYVAEEVSRVFLSRKACEDLGIIPSSFPIIGAFGIEADSTVDNIVNDDFTGVIKSFKSCDGLDNGKCSCPTRELPPKAPESCPFPPTPDSR